MKNTIDDSELDTSETAQSTLPALANAAGKEIRLSVLKHSSDVLSEGISDTMNYADNCMSELLSQMEQVSGCAVSSAPEKMHSIALGARTLAEVMREKVEAMKLLRSLSKNGN